MKQTLTTLLITLLISSGASAQRIVGELEANTDMLMTPNDSALNRYDDDTKKEKKQVPVDISAWTIDAIYGNQTPTIVDTLAHQIQNHNLSEGKNGHYNPLGNLGSPRLNHIFMERRDIGGDFIFLRPFDQFFVTSDQFRYYDIPQRHLRLLRFEEHRRRPRTRRLHQQRESSGKLRWTLRLHVWSRLLRLTIHILHGLVGMDLIP